MPAQKGNKILLGKKYKTKVKNISELSKKADIYFSQCKNDNKIPYLTGFYVFLGISHSYFYDWIQRKPGDSEAIKAIWMKFASEYEGNMGDRKLMPAHAIFMLKNCGFSDNISVNATVSGSVGLADMAKEARNQKSKQAK